jgi:hypothetical protein
VPINDDAASDDSLPLFLSDDADKAEQRRSFPIRKMGLVILAALAVEAAAVALGPPVARLVAVSASLVDASAPDKDQAGQPAQAAVDAQASSPSESDAAADQPTTATAEAATAEPAATAVQQPAKDKAASDALFSQFQAWAQKQNSMPDPQQEQAQESPVQAVEDPPAQPALPKQSVESTQSAPARVRPTASGAPVRTAQKRAPAHELRNARAEMEAARKSQARLARANGAPTHAAAEDVRSPEPPAQSQTPSLLQIFGWR